MQMHTFCNEVYSFLGLKRPFEIRVKSKSHKDNWAGSCTQHTRKDKITKHVIVVYIPGMVYSEFDFYSVIAHEFIHAWQAENDLLGDESTYHDVHFQGMARKVTKHFSRYYVDMIEVYSPESDIDDKALD